MIRKYAAEFIGTFIIVFCGTGAIVVNQMTGGTISHAGIAATFGLVVLAMVYTFGEVSGGHFNPAVTLAFSVAKLFPVRQILPYIIAQTSGAFLASVLLKLLFPETATLGVTLPSGTVMQSFVLEILLAFMLMIVVLNVSQGSKEIGIMAGIAVGATILLEALFAGPISGASMNPARSLAPAVVSGNMTSLWIYLTAPVAGTVLATLLWMGMRRK